MSTFDQTPLFNSNNLIFNQPTFEEHNIKDRGTFIYNFVYNKKKNLEKNIFGFLHYPDTINFTEFNHTRAVNLDNQSNFLGYIRFSNRLKFFESVDDYNPKILITYFKNNALFRDVNYLAGEVPFLNSARKSILNKFFKISFSPFYKNNLPEVKEINFNVDLQKRNSIIFDESQR